MAKLKKIRWAEPENPQPNSERWVGTLGKLTIELSRLVYRRRPAQKWDWSTFVGRSVEYRVAVFGQLPAEMDAAAAKAAIPSTVKDALLDRFIALELQAKKREAQLLRRRQALVIAAVRLTNAKA